MNVLSRNHITVRGKGTQPLVFAHGFGSSQEAWSQVSPAFENDYKVILFDYVGSGRSDKKAYSEERYQSLNGYADDLIEVCESLNLSDVTVIGHSVSGMISTLASLKRPDLFKQLFMIAPSPRYLNEPGYHGGFTRDEISGLLDMMEKNFKEWAKYLAPVAAKNANRPHLAENFEHQLLSNDQKIARQFAEATFLVDMRDVLKDVTLPVTILQPSDDTIVPHEVAVFLDQQFQDSRLIILKATGHNPHISHPEEVVKYIHQTMI
ncbi:alpha/beta fold hydrolase [Jeotgalibacillus aurantiacus]|uniref:alpha/beta fold hydrolase n=1 Tax=Jeotgalibacillus aurantiacus TaxID=2763266 RepID=UPI001D0A3A75|nr:alpha/beta hydrolase [Jeotgalibacillus aurantiacus]